MALFCFILFYLEWFLQIFADVTSFSDFVQVAKNLFSLQLDGTAGPTRGSTHEIGRLLESQVNNSTFCNFENAMSQK